VAERVAVSAEEARVIKQAAMDTAEATPQPQTEEGSYLRLIDCCITQL